MRFREIRLKTANFRTSLGENKELLVSGYVNLTGHFSDPLSISTNEHFIETIEPGAFARSIEQSRVDGKDIDFLVEHDHTKILSSTRNNSLYLEEDEKGLFMSAVIVPTTYGEDFYKLIKDGIIRNFSFGFMVEDEDWDFGTEPYTRVIKDLELFEVSAVRHPAYPQSFVEARDLTSSDSIMEVRRLEQMEDKKEMEVREDMGAEEEVEEVVGAIDVSGSIIAIDQRLETIEAKLDEVLAIFLDQKEEVQEEEIEEAKEEKEAEKEAKLEEGAETDERNKPVEEETQAEVVEDTIEEREAQEAENKSINIDAVNKLKAIINEYEDVKGE